MWAALSSGAGRCVVRVLPFFSTAGASPGGVVLGTQSQWRLCSVSIPWQVPAPLGEDERATYLGRGEGDGELRSSSQRQLPDFFLAHQRGSSFSLWQSLAPHLVGFLITNHSLVLRCLGWLPSSAWLHCCLKLSGDSTTGIACALLPILHCRCLANLLSILCFCPTSQTSMVVVLLAIVNKLLLLSCAHFYWSVLGTVQQVAVVGWWRAPFLLNAACFLFPLSKHE